MQLKVNFKTGYLGEYFDLRECEGGHVARREEIRNAYKIFIGKPEGERQV
jgi:hypothetical protein